MNRPQAQKVARIIRRRFNGVDATLVYLGRTHGWVVRAHSDIDDRGIFICWPHRRERQECLRLRPDLPVNQEKSSWL